MNYTRQCDWVCLSKETGMSNIVTKKSVIGLPATILEHNANIGREEKRLLLKGC